MKINVCIQIFELSSLASHSLTCPAGLGLCSRRPESGLTGWPVLPAQASAFTWHRSVMSGKTALLFPGLPFVPEPRRTFQVPFSPLFVLFLVDYVRAHSMNSAHGKGCVKTDCCPRTFLSGRKSFVCSLCVPRSSEFGGSQTRGLSVRCTNSCKAAV